MAGGRFVYYVKGYIILSEAKATKTPMSEFVQRPVEGQWKQLVRLTGRKIRVKKDGQNQARTFNYLRRYIIREVAEVVELCVAWSP